MDTQFLANVPNRLRAGWKLLYFLCTIYVRFYIFYVLTFFSSNRWVHFRKNYSSFNSWSKIVFPQKWIFLKSNFVPKNCTQIVQFKSIVRFPISSPIRSILARGFTQSKKHWKIQYFSLFSKIFTKILIILKYFNILKKNARVCMFAC